jgi:hypothetical protein
MSPADLVGALDALASTVTGPPRVSQSGDDVRNAFAVLRAAQTYAYASLGMFVRDGGWQLEGAGSPVSWLAHNAALTRHEAARTVATAEVIAYHEPVAEALLNHTVVPAHVHQLAALRRHRAQRFGDDVVVLVDAATQLSPESYRHVAKHWTALADDTVSHRERDEANWLDMTPTFAGSWILRGMLDPMRGTALYNAINEHAAPSDVNDTRTASERRADALHTLVFGDVAVRPQVDVIVDVDTLIGHERPVEAIRNELRGIGAIDRVLLERLTCDAALGRVLVRGTSENLDLGRRTRVTPPSLRRAVTLRDEHCVWPGCDRPPRACDIHHITPWQHGGHTHIDNLALLCGRHHTLTHNGWKLTHHHGTWEAQPP